MSVHDLEMVESGRLSPGAVREILDRHAIEVSEIEGFGEWLATGRAQQDEARRAEERVYELADLVGARATNVGVFTDALPPLDLLVERYGALCDRAAEHGLAIG